MQLAVILIFLFVYLGMFLGEIPGLALDRTGIALVGAILVMMTGVLEPMQAWDAVDVPTIALLFGLMVVSSQFRLGGFYSAVTLRLSEWDLSPARFLFWLMAVSGILSAILANDIVCLAMTPILIEGCLKRGLNPIPFAIGLACSANVGSAATLIGNPQNMLIGQKLQVSFSGYLLDSLVPVLLGMVASWGLLCRLYHHRWHTNLPPRTTPHQPFNAWQSSKGFVVVMVLLLIFLFTSLPRELAALAAAGVLLMSRRMASREMLGLVDWQVLVLFIGLFVVNHALESSGVLGGVIQGMQGAGIDPTHPGLLFGLSVILSNLVSNVPAVMLLLPVATHPLAAAVLALSSTLAGNLIIVGSIANIIVVDKAAEFGITISWREHAHAGVPITGITLLIAGGWLWLRGGF
ncbi:MAG: anion transporter [bacterium]|jgi:Na+/H+ antiporter NhaD/arsenite permease-like protein|nr:anion transporter [bacterium]